MGTFHHPMTVTNPESGMSLTVDALVDSGATFSVLPTSQLEGLGVRPTRRIRAEVADGRVVEFPLGEASINVLDRSGTSPCVFGPEDGPTLLGMVTLEGLLLGIDPVRQVLVPVDALLMPMRLSR